LGTAALRLTPTGRPPKDHGAFLGRALALAQAEKRPADTPQACPVPRRHAALVRTLERGNKEIGTTVLSEDPQETAEQPALWFMQDVGELACGETVWHRPGARCRQPGG
jgi:hypothetical protein